jgi:hypothetical protein
MPLHLHAANPDLSAKATLHFSMSCYAVGQPVTGKEQYKMMVGVVAKDYAFIITACSILMTEHRLPRLFARQGNEA